MTAQTPAELLKCCPIDNTFKIIGKKFTVHIIRNIAMQGQTRFNQFLGSIEGANPKTLSARLKEMEKAGLITRQVYDEAPIRVEYNLTKKGKDLQGILDQMASFSMKHYSKTVFKDGKQRNYKQVFKKASHTFKLISCLCSKNSTATRTSCFIN